MSERKQPDRIAKKRTHEMMIAKSKPRKFDLIGELLSNYGEMTGGNITHEIFSYLDFSALQQSRLVSKSWNHFLVNDKKIWLQILKKHLHNLNYFTNQLADEEKNSTFWKVGKNLKGIIRGIKQVQSTFEILKICAEQKQKRFENFAISNYLPQTFNDDYIGKKVKKEIRREIKKGEKRKFMVVLQQQIADLEQVKRWKALFHGHGYYNNYHHTEIRRIKAKILHELNNYFLNVQ
jgi:hypothetical protein